MPILLALLPDILLIALGGLVKSKLPQDGWRAVDALSFHVLFPALIFSASAGTSIGGEDLVIMGLGTWLIMGTGCGLAALLRPLGPASSLDFAGLWQTAWRFNTAIALVAIQTMPEVQRGYMAIAIGTAVPLANIMAIAVLSHGNALSARRTLLLIARNPFFLASLSGLIVSMTGLRIPAPVLELAHKLAAAAIPLALLSIGASLSWRALARLDPFFVLLNAIKLLALPLMTLMVAGLIGLDKPHTATLVLFAALPTASAAHVLASVFGADREMVATMIAQSTLLGCPTLVLWLWLLS